MSCLLLWLALPLLLVPWLAGAHRIGASAGQLVMAGIGLAALHQGAGTLDPRDLHTIADQSSHDAWFVAITAGALIAGACFLPDIRNWRKGLAALPLLVGLLLAGLPHFIPLAVGLVIGAVPTLLGSLIGGAGPSFAPQPAKPESEVPIGSDVPSLALGGLTLVTAVVGPALLGMSGLAALSWREWQRCQIGRLPRRVPVLPVIAAALIAAWTWLALTISGSPLVSLRWIAEAAPVSPAAGQGLALLAIGWAIAIAAPWPFDRLGGVGVRLPVVAVVLYLAGVTVTPDGMAHWQPVTSTVLVASALVAIARARWDGAAAAIMLLAAMRGGGIALLGAVMMALAPAVRRMRLPATLRSAMASIAVAPVLIVVLRDQVLLSVIIALGIASLAGRADHLVARISGSVHL